MTSNHRNDAAHTAAPDEHLCSRHSSLDALLTKVGGGDRDAFASLYDEMSSTVYGMSLTNGRDPALASQITLDVFLRAWQQASTYDLATQSAWTWMRTLALEATASQSRRARPAPTEPSPTPPTTVDRVDRTHSHV